MSNDELINLIINHNPFDRPLVVRKNDIWVPGFPDVPSLNAHASNAVYDAIEKVRSSQRPVIGITITAEKGLGKSHLISRIRRKIKDDGSALFVYMSEFGDLNQIKSEFLQTLANSLKQLGGQGVSQWRELATVLFNQACNQNRTAQEIIEAFNPALLETLVDKVLEIKPDIENPDIITAILWTLSLNAADERFAINWLSGKELPALRANKMGLPNPIKESEAFNTIRQILDLISDYKPIIVCFDELESLNSNETGYTQAQVAAMLGKDLYDKLKRGVILTAIYPETWTHQVKHLPYAEAVTDRIGEKIIELTYLNPDNVVILVSRWLEEYYHSHSLMPPHHVFPFSENQLRELGKERPTVRTVLQWCAKNFHIPADSTILPDSNIVTIPVKEQRNPVESAYQKELAAIESNIQDCLENKEAIAKALRFAFSTLKGNTLEKVYIQEIEEVKAKSKDKLYRPDFKIVGRENGSIVKIGVLVGEGIKLQYLQAALTRLVDYEKFDLTRGCLVRAKQIKPGTQTMRRLNELLSPKLGGEWAMLKADDMKSLLAISSLVDARVDYDLSLEQINDFIATNSITMNNNLIREILSDPSGEIPADAEDEDF